MKKLMNYCMLSFLVFATGVATAKPVPGSGTPGIATTGTTDKTSQDAGNGTDIITVYDMPNVFADAVVNSTAAYDISTNNIFADDVFTDDVKNGDVLIADVITANTTTTDGLTVSSMDMSSNPANGTITIKTEARGKFYYYTEPHTDKAGNIINGGQNTLYVQQVLSPGVYLCSYEGPDGTTASVKVVCKK